MPVYYTDRVARLTRYIIFPKQWNSETYIGMTKRIWHPFIDQTSRTAN
jgi:hypothetical protein